MPDEHGRCPSCGHITEKPYDYDVLGNDLFHCGVCGVVFVHPEGSVAIVVDANGF